MLVNMKEMLQDAQRKHYGVGMFNTVNLEMAKGVLAAAEALRAPVIIGTAEVLLPYATLEEIAYFLKPMAEKASVPVALHFDHGLTEEKVREALALGFTSVMYDCSTVSYSQNAERVAGIVKLARTYGATVEAELGHVGDNVDAAEGHGGATESLYTDPAQAADFVDRTGADALAVAIGSAHGAYKQQPKLDIDRLRQIAAKVSVPLVLHGGSGLTDDDFRNCVQNGIAKVNVFTDINCACVDAIIQAYRKGCGMTDVMNAEVDAVCKATMEKMRVFGCEGRA